MGSVMGEIYFQIEYLTKWGERLILIWDDEGTGGRECQNMICRHSGERLLWELRVNVSHTSILRYKYAIMGENNRLIKEETETRELEASLVIVPGGVTQIRDVFQDCADPNNLLFRSAFSEVIFGGRTRTEGDKVDVQSAEQGSVIIHFKCWCWTLGEGDVVGLKVHGDSPEQGIRIAMKETTTPYWEVQVTVPENSLPVRYNYFVQSADSMEEEGDDVRSVGVDVGLGKTVDLIPSLIGAFDGAVRQSEPWRGAGLAVPVFSLRGQSSVGCGEFVDLRTLADLCSAAGIRIIQLLPINDTSVYNMWWDSYPYNSISVFALHPLYLCLDALSDEMSDEVKEMIAAKREALDLPAVDYEATLDAKHTIAREVFDASDHKLLETEEYQAWFEANSHWLKPYAIFCFLRDLFGTADHRQWGTFSQPSNQMLDRLSSPKQAWHENIRFTYYIQYQLHRQLLAVSNYAKSKGVALKGDLPIGVSKMSVETWTCPEEYHMEFSTGAPPDYFDAAGQNWGFPTYNWEVMKKTGYAWWRARLTHMAQYFHAYRIDHILGFFRIWEIPGDCTSGLLGHFRPSIPTSRASLEAQGLWDIDRLCLPWITTSILKETFGDRKDWVSAQYFHEHLPGRFLFNEQYNSETKLEAALDARSPPGLEKQTSWVAEDHVSLKQDLMALMHNVVLLKDAEADAYTPRISLMETSSFAELPAHWQNHLRWLHDDYHYHRHTQLWSAQALESLPALMTATDMLVCGEDLGMVPECVHPVLRTLGLLGLRIQRMSAGDEEFGNPSTYPYLTVASPSCHDTSTTRAWYEEDPDRRQRFVKQALGLASVPDLCTPEIMTAVFQQHLQSPSMWAIFPLQDFLGLSHSFGSRAADEETINDPTNSRHYWRYRMHVSLEDLLGDATFVSRIQDLLVDSGRCKRQELERSL